MFELNDGNFKDFIKEGKVIVDVWLKFDNGQPCSYCTEFSPIFEEVSKQYPNIKFAKLLINDCSEFKKEYFKMGKGYKISFPTVLTFENGELKHRHVGRMYEPDFKKFIETGQVEDDKTKVMKLKSQAFDFIKNIEIHQVQIQQIQNQLQQINAEIEKLENK